MFGNILVVSGSFCQASEWADCDRLGLTASRPAVSWRASMKYLHHGSTGGNLARKRRIGVIGVGRVGSALAWHCRRLKCKVVGIADSSKVSLRSARRLLGPGVHSVEPRELAATSDVLFITTTDRAISTVYRYIANELRPGTIVAHCSGAIGPEIFDDALERRLGTLALHPLRVMASTDQAVSNLPGSFFVLAGSRAGVSFGRSFVRALGGEVLRLRADCRPLYHAMCVFASNFLLAGLVGAEVISKRLGIARQTAQPALLKLAVSALTAVSELGLQKSLTGPIARGDVETVEANLAALQSHLPELVQPYREFSRLLLEYVRRRRLPDSTLGKLRATLGANE